MIQDRKQAGKNKPKTIAPTKACLSPPKKRIIVFILWICVHCRIPAIFGNSHVLEVFRLLMCLVMQRFLEFFIVLSKINQCFGIQETFSYRLVHENGLIS